MGWRNTEHGFGRISRLIHWAMAALIIGQLLLGLRIADMQPGLANLWLYGLHKTIGFAALALILLRLGWHRFSPPPPPLGDPKALANRAARAAHRLLYTLLLVIPLSGWIASSATGIDVMVLERWTMPVIAPISEAWEKNGFLVHSVAGKVLMAILLLHVAGALLRAIQGDGTLDRMISGGE